MPRPTEQQLARQRLTATDLGRNLMETENGND